MKFNPFKITEEERVQMRKENSKKVMKKLEEINEVFELYPHEEYYRDEREQWARENRRQA